MQFQIAEARTVHLRALNSRVENHGDQLVPAVSLHFTVSGSAALLDMLDPEIRKTFWRAERKQDRLPGTGEVEPTILRCKTLDGGMTIRRDFAGYCLTVRGSVTGDEIVTLDGCAVNGFKVDPKPDGFMHLRFKVDVACDDPFVRGTLDTMLGTDFDITLVPAEVQPEGKPVPDATTVFAGQGEPADAVH